jgi:Zn-dependent M28 family amino/carboxypeptidase
MKKTQHILGLFWIGIFLFSCQPAAPAQFDGQRALQHVETQMAFGPRTVGSEAHAQMVAWLVGELEKANWSVEIVESPHGEVVIRNVAARRGSGHLWVLLGAHYDSRFLADHDPDPLKQTQPVPGANDGASGVAVLLELARVLPADTPGQVWLVFFDAEDNGRIAGWDWILGSLAFAQQFQGDVDKPDAAVIVDMIGDADLNIYREKNSDADLSDQIWAQAAELGYTQFIDQPKYRMLDDHIPFRDAGIPALDIIDFDYPYWHTSEDTLDKVSAASLDAVGDTVQAWLAKFLVASP